MQHNIFRFLYVLYCEGCELVKRCLFCGRFFTPDPRVGDRQKACHRKKCRNARKQLAQDNWNKKNTAYFKNQDDKTQKTPVNSASVKSRDGKSSTAKLSIKTDEHLGSKGKKK